MFRRGSPKRVRDSTQHLLGATMVLSRRIDALSRATMILCSRRHASVMINASSRTVIGAPLRINVPIVRIVNAPAQAQR